MNPAKFPSRVVDRFLAYVRVDTQSKEGAEAYPSTPGQLDLLRRVADELRELGAADVEMDRYGYVFATIPATTKKRDVPVIGFLAHVDTSPEMSGADVRPIVHRDYRGQDLVLPDDPTIVLRVADHPALGEQIGNDIITASGKTLLGADNKAGVAEIVSAAEVLLAHPEIPHGTIRLGFTPDEEVGTGTKYFDVARFGARYAYTMDGETLGEIESETFSADTFLATFHGCNTHPGYAKGKMVNSIRVAADFLQRLPRERMSPETTEDYEGYVHPYVVEASVDKTTVRVLVRDFRTPGLKDKEDALARWAGEATAAWPGCRLETRIEESYRNMKEVLDQHPQAVENAREGIRRAGLTVRERPIRGGTDGARLSFQGLPTPNVFAGEHAFHSRSEWISAYDMHKAVETIIEIARVWEERAQS